MAQRGITILPQSPSVASAIGEALRGFGAMGMQRQQQLQQQESLANALQQLGVSQDQAQAIGQLPPQIQQNVIQSTLQSLGQQQTDPFTEMFGGLSQPSQQPAQPESDLGEMISTMQEAGIETPQVEEAQRQQQMPDISPFPGLQQLFQTQNAMQNLPGKQQFVAPTNPQDLVDTRSPNTQEEIQATNQMLQQPHVQKQLNNLEQQQIKSQPDDPDIDLKRMLANSKLDQKFKEKIYGKLIDRQTMREGKEATQQNKIVDKVFPVYQKWQESAERADQNISRLDKLQELIQSGNLQDVGAARFFDTLGGGIHVGPYRVGLDLDVFKNPESSEFESIVNSMVEGMKDVYGGNVSQREMEQFMKRFPSLAQTDSGKQRIINFLKEMSQASTIKADIADDIIAKNDGKITANLQSQVRKQMKPRLKELQDMVKETNRMNIEKAAKARSVREIRTKEPSGMAQSVKRMFSEGPLSIIPFA